MILANRGGDKSCVGVLQVQIFSKEERRKRALKWGGGAFLIALATLPLPLVHFVVPPLFILIAPFVARYQWRQERLIYGGVASCPVCSKDFPFAKRQPSFPFDDVCTSCRQAIRVTEATKI